MKHFKRNFRSQQKGVTLIELGVGFAILAMVVTAIFIKSNAGQANAQGSQAAEHMKGIANAVAQWELLRGNFSGMTCNSLVQNNLVTTGLASCTGGAPNGGNFTASVSGRTLTIAASGQSDRACISAVNFLSNFGSGSTATCSSGTVTFVVQMS